MRTVVYFTVLYHCQFAGLESCSLVKELPLGEVGVRVWEPILVKLL